VIFLETAELRVKNRIDITMNFWRENVDRILDSNDRIIIKDTGTISNAQMEKKVKEIYQLFDSKRKIYEANQADIKEIEEIKNKIEKNKKLN
jgi:hypothetical protein